MLCINTEENLLCAMVLVHFTYGDVGSRQPICYLQFTYILLLIGSSPTSEPKAITIFVNK